MLLHNATGVVFDRRLELGHETFTDSYSACLYRVGHRFAIGHGGYAPGTGTGEESFRLRGSYVTFEWSGSDKYAGTYREQVEQYDLRSGRRTFVVTYGAEPRVRPVDPASSESELELAVGSGGQAAWLVQGNGCPGSPSVCPYEALIVHDERGAQTVASYPIESFAAPAIRTLAVSNSRVTWVQGGHSLTAALVVRSARP